MIHRFNHSLPSSRLSSPVASGKQRSQFSGLSVSPAVDSADLDLTREPTQAINDEKYFLPITRRPTYPAYKNLGLDPVSVVNLDSELAQTGDAPYHGGRLLHGKIYVITNKDKIYYGTPQSLEPLTLTSITRTKCINQQERTFQSADGLFFRVKNNQGQRTASVSIPSWFGFYLTIPHLVQEPFK